MLRRSAEVFDLICQTSTKLNNILSIPVLLIILTNFTVITISAFAFIFSLMHTDNILLKNSSPMMPVMFFTNWMRVLFLLSAADLPVIQANSIDLYLVTTYFSSIFSFY